VCGCERWCCTLRGKKKNRLARFEDKVLRRVLGFKTEAATRGWRKLHNDELHNLSSS